MEENLQKPSPVTMILYLIDNDNTTPSQNWEIIPKKKYTIGRSKKEVDLPLNIKLVSRKHAELTYFDSKTIMIKDLDSRNGTFLDKQRIDSSKEVIFTSKHILSLGNLSNEIVFFDKNEQGKEILESEDEKNKQSLKDSNSQDKNENSKKEKQKLETKIELMNLQMIKGGEKIEETPQFKNKLQEMEKDFEKRILEIKKEKEQIEDSKSQVEAYNKLLYQQRDIMNSLYINLNEKEEIINELTKEKNKLENTIIEISNIIKLKDKYIIELEKLLDNNKIKHKEYSKLDNNKIDLNKLNINNINKMIFQNKKTYIPYLEQNGKDYINKAMPLLTSEENNKISKGLRFNKNKIRKE